MNTRQIAVAAAFLALMFVAHAAGRVLQVGGAQLDPSISVFTLMALLMAPSLRWGGLVGIALAIGLLTTLTSSSPFPPANIPAEGIAFLLAAYLARRLSPDKREISTVQIIAVYTVTLLVGWTIFALVTWWGLTGTAFTGTAFERFDIDFGTGFLAWWLFGFVSVGIPSWILGAILTPILYRAVRPALIRQGMIEAPAG